MKFFELFNRICLLTLRSPQIIFNLIGISTFVSVLLSSLFSGIGQMELDLFDYLGTMRTMKNWIGFSAYLVIDSFAAGLFANVLANSAFLPVFKREFKAGLYSPTMYYFGTWLIKVFFLSFYPALLFSFVYWRLDLKDSSPENFKFLLKIAVVSGLNSSTLGHMWSTFSQDPMKLIVSAMGAISMVQSGSGVMVRSSSNAVVASLVWLSPLSKTLELVLRCITSGQVSQ